MNTFEKTYYVDKIGYDVKYCLGENELGIVMTGEIYWCFNGLMRVVVV